jgi:hypothetical protein
LLPVCWGSCEMRGRCTLCGIECGYLMGNEFCHTLRLPGHIVSSQLGIDELCDSH